MRHTIRVFIAVTILALLISPLAPRNAPAAPPPATPPKDSSGLINEALDKPVEVELKTTLPNALQEIKNRTGVPIELAPGVLDLLPWGEQTNLDVKIANQTLRQAISAIARTLGLTYVLTPESVELRPMPALQRLGRRATVDELKVLDLLASTQLGLDKSRPTLLELVDAIDQKLVALKSDFSIEYRADASLRKEPPAVTVPRNATMAQALDAIAKDTPLAWGPWGHSVLIKSKESWTRDQLEKLVTRRFDAQDVGQVLSDLADYSGVDFTIEPGSLQRISAQSRTITLILENRSVAQVLELIAGFTGLSYSVNEKGVYIWNQSAGGPAGSSSQDPVVAMLSIPGSDVQVMLRQSDVPDDVRQYIKQSRGKAVDKLREMMKKEGFKPATQPTTKPAPELEPPKDL